MSLGRAQRDPASPGGLSSASSDAEIVDVIQHKFAKQTQIKDFFQRKSSHLSSELALESANAHQQDPTARVVPRGAEGEG